MARNVDYFSSDVEMVTAFENLCGDLSPDRPPGEHVGALVVCFDRGQARFVKETVAEVVQRHGAIFSSLNRAWSFPNGNRVVLASIDEDRLAFAGLSALSRIVADKRTEGSDWIRAMRAKVRGPELSRLTHTPTTRGPRPCTMTGIQLDDAEELLSSLRGQLPRLRGAMAAGDGATVTETLGALRDVLRRLAHAARDIGAILPGEMSTIENIEHCYTVEDCGPAIEPDLRLMCEASAADVWTLIGCFDLTSKRRLKLWARAAAPVTTRMR